MSSSWPLSSGASVTLDGAGAGSVVLGPGRPSEHWSVTRYTTSGASTTEPSLQVFRGAGMIDTTKRGNADVSEQTIPIALHAGEALTFTYTGGTPGAVMVIYLEGTVTIS